MLADDCIHVINEQLQTLNNTYFHGLNSFYEIEINVHNNTGNLDSID